MENIMIIGDNPSLADYLQNKLNNIGAQVNRTFRVEHYTNKEDANIHLAQKNYCVHLFQQAMDTHETKGIIAFMRNISYLRVVPIIFVAHNKSTELVAYESGATSCLDANASMEEIYLCLVSQLRWYFHMNFEELSSTKIVEYQGLRMDYAAYYAMLAGEELSLTANEFDLLYLLAKNAGRVMTYGMISDWVWRNQIYIEMNKQNIHALIHRIRSKVGTEHFMIESVSSRGYRLKASKSVLQLQI